MTTREPVLQTVLVKPICSSILPRTLLITRACLKRPRQEHRQRVPIDDPAVIAAGVTERDETDEEQTLRDVVRYVRKQMLATASMVPALARSYSSM